MEYRAISSGVIGSAVNVNGSTFTSFLAFFSFFSFFSSAEGSMPCSFNYCFFNSFSAFSFSFFSLFACMYFAFSIAFSCSFFAISSFNLASTSTGICSYFFSSIFICYFLKILNFYFALFKIFFFEI